MKVFELWMDIGSVVNDPQASPTYNIVEKFNQRNLHVHNAQITLMRTTITENEQIARWIANKLNRSTSAFTLVLPEGGVSLLDAEGQVFYDPDADKALFDTLEREIVPGPKRKILRLPYNINAPEFATILVEQYLNLLDVPNGLNG